MARRLIKVLLMLVLAGLIMAPVKASPSTRQHAGQDQPSELDRLFMVQAAQAGLFEIQKSQLALERSTNKHVRRFAQRMIRDHTRQSAELAALAARKGVTLPQQPSELQQQILQRLGQLSGREFNCAYMSVQVAAHLQAIALFKTEATLGTDEEVRAFALRWLPGLKMHLRKAVRLVHRLDC
jgi:putative membrane protein